MNKIFQLLLLLAIAFTSHSPLVAQRDKAHKSKAPQIHEYAKTGKFGFAKKPKAIKLELGKWMGAKATIRASTFFGKPSIACQVDVHNKSKQKIYLCLQIAFFDAKGKLIGCASQNMDFDPGEKTIVAGAVVRAPARAMAQIAKYQLRYWESPTKL